MQADRQERERDKADMAARLTALEGQGSNIAPNLFVRLYAALKDGGRK